MSDIPLIRHVNHFSGSPLNRLSWLRPLHLFLNSIIQAPRSRWILFNNLKPLTVVPSTSESTLALAYLTTQDVVYLLGPPPYFGQDQHLGDLVVDFADTKHDIHSPTESIRHRGPRIVFLGFHETGESKTTSLPSSDLTDPEMIARKLEGTAYFSMDISDVGLTDEQLQHFIDITSLAQKGDSLVWSEPLPVISLLDNFAAAAFASARSLVDWNRRNKFCPGCGSPSYSMWGGWKIACTSLLPWAEPTDKPCFTAKGLHNFMHPRTDTVVIMIAIDESCDKILLGRGRRYPGKFYGPLAGFIEPGESLEDAVAREMIEEAGVLVWDVKYHSGQPWPFPTNLSIGFYARADSTKPVRIDLDKELADVRWYTRQEVKAVLGHPNGSNFRRDEFQKMNQKMDERQNTVVRPGTVELVSKSSASSVVAEGSDRAMVVDEPRFKVPPATSISGVLIRDWVNGKIGFEPERGDGVAKGNL